MECKPRAKGRLKRCAGPMRDNRRIRATQGTEGIRNSGSRSISVKGPSSLYPMPDAGMCRIPTRATDAGYGSGRAAYAIHGGIA